MSNEHTSFGDTPNGIPHPKLRDLEHYMRDADFPVRPQGHGGHPGRDDTAANQVPEWMKLLKLFIASGFIDPTDLGLTPPAAPAPATPAPAIPAPAAPVAAEPAAPPTDAGVTPSGPGGLPQWFIVPGEEITIRDLVRKTKDGLKPSTRRAYGCYLDLLADGYTDGEHDYPGIGDKLAHQVLPSDLEAALAVVQERALRTAARRAEVRESVDRAARESTGAGARYNAIGAWRRAFQVAVDDRHLAEQFNPAQKLKKPTRLTGSRRPLTTTQMTAFWAVVQNTGNDPELDMMICQTILISGARRGGLTGLTLGGIDRVECTLHLHEKGEKSRYQPVPDWFADQLYDFARGRGAVRRNDKVFRLGHDAPAPGKPITSRRLDNLFQRVQATLPWADKAQVSAHTLRHHAIAMVERLAGKQVAAVFAGHEPADTTSLYGRASREEVAQAVIDLHGGRHPWLETDPAE